MELEVYKNSEFYEDHISSQKEYYDEKKPERKEQHRRYNQTDAGKASMKRRKARYLATDNGRRKTREKSRRYYKRHKEDPAFKENRHHINVMRWAKVKKDRLMGYYVLWTMDGVIKIRLV